TMTTGAVTMAEYRSDRYMSERTSYIAENDHVYGAIIVEIEDKDRFHFRQIQADVTGAFYDLGMCYSAEGVEPVRPILVMGDLHAGEQDEDVMQCTYEMIQDLNVKDIVVHDAF